MSFLAFWKGFLLFFHKISGTLVTKTNEFVLYCTRFALSLKGEMKR